MTAHAVHTATPPQRARAALAAHPPHGTSIPPQSVRPAPPAIRVTERLATPVPYADGLLLQESAADRLVTGTDHGTLILLEHEAVYTAGRRSDPSDFPVDGTPVVPVNRGGKVTWHGPGQLVGYPVVRLATGVGVVDCVRALEGALLETAAAFGVTGIRIDGRAGAWAAPAPGIAPVKFGQVGIHASAGIITHGVALNCSNSLDPFANFVPCGITDAGVSTLSELAGRTITPADAAPHLRSALLRALEGITA